MPDSQQVTIAPDAHAYAITGASVALLGVLWAVVAWRQGHVGWTPFAVIAALAAAGFSQIASRTVSLGDGHIVQGWPPFRTTIAYQDISRIHRIYVSSRYGSTPCLAISPRSKSRGRLTRAWARAIQSGSAAGDIVMPVKAFSAEKRSRLIRMLAARAPNARVDPQVTGWARADVAAAPPRSE